MDIALQVFTCLIDSLLRNYREPFPLLSGPVSSMHRNDLFHDYFRVSWRWFINSKRNYLAGIEIK